VNAVFAADAVARLSGSIGVAAVTAGPGLTNTITAVKNAQMAESPILLLGGAAANLLKGRGALQDINQMDLFKPLCKRVYTVRYIKDIPSIIRQAIHVAKSDTPGPVFVEFPIDTLYPYHLVAKEFGIKNNQSKSLINKLTNLYLENYLNSLFAGAFSTDHQMKPIEPSVKLPDENKGMQK
jgi:acetolactate synthase-like protein